MERVLSQRIDDNLLTTSPKRILKFIAVFLVALVFFLAVWSIFIEPGRLIVRSETITIQNWPKELDNLKIVAIGDIHPGSPFVDEEKLRKLVSLTNEQQPDLIVLLGDYMVREQFYRRVIDPEVTASILKDFKAPLGVYAVVGNHDWWFDGVRVRKAFEGVGIRVLDNEVSEIKRNEAAFWLVGLADAWTGEQAIRGTFAKVTNSSPVLVITHNPDLFVQLPASANLMLAAHTHGGQVNLPLLGRLIVPSDYGQRFAAGHIEENGKHLFVTTGVGTSILPLRFRVPPEIAVINVR